ncbi:uncharacterized protein LOC111411483 [Olea europaea var. sylvestris]|uniref:uncharacterized protein LOC111411483 n=1 Tax=Olea europaea var. sylvestris TaxID=158386 RepID=UPI000C1D5AB8|nr:uncharacterized protein LOC111411483 [Olea europaea var. sylvestris]
MSMSPKILRPNMLLSSLKSKSPIQSLIPYPTNQKFQLEDTGPQLLCRPINSVGHNEKMTRSVVHLVEAARMKVEAPSVFPFLLVDRVVEYNPGVSAVAIKNVTINDNFFPGHFPERPIMPGVLMVETKDSFLFSDLRTLLFIATSLYSII